MKNYFIVLLVNNNLWYYFFLERQFSWGGSLLKSTGGEYEIYFKFYTEKEE